MASLCPNEELLKRLVLDEGKLHDVLYGRWTDWGGRKPPTFVRQELIRKLPKGILKNTPSEISLDVSSISSDQIGVFAASVIEEKTIIGPVSGRHMNTLAIDEGENAWEVLDERENITSYLHTLDGQNGSWMGFIQCARHSDEQNLQMFQDGSDIFYSAMRDIQVGEELLVWYGFQIPQCFGIPYFETQSKEKKCLNTETDNSETVLVTASDEDRKKAKCVLCHKGFNSRSNLRSHMRTHTQQRPFKCSTCGRRFSQSSTLRNHVRLHTGEKPYKCSICNSAYSQLAGLRAHQKSSQHRPKLQTRNDTHYSTDE